MFIYNITKENLYDVKNENYNKITSKEAELAISSQNLSDYEDFVDKFQSDYFILIILHIGTAKEREKELLRQKHNAWREWRDINIELEFLYKIAKRLNTYR